jgi:hypothetical protein
LLAGSAERQLEVKALRFLEVVDALQGFQCEPGSDEATGR